MTSTTNLVRRPLFGTVEATPAWFRTSGPAPVGGKDSRGNTIVGLQVGTGTAAVHTTVDLAAGDVLTVYVAAKLGSTIAPSIRASLVPAATDTSPALSPSSIDLAFPKSNYSHNTITGQLTAPAAGPYLLRLASWSASTFDVSGVRLTKQAEPDTLGIFDGDTTDTDALFYSWTGEPGLSASIASTDAPVVVPPPTPDPEPDPAPDPPPGLEPQVPSVSGLSVALFLGHGDNPEFVDMATVHATVITAMVFAYTRGQGFNAEGDPSPTINAVITTATARLLANPDQIKSRVGEISLEGGFSGWTLPELSVLNNFRRRTR